MAKDEIGTAIAEFIWRRSKDELSAIGVCRRVLEEVEQEIRYYAHTARREGASWAQIGEQLGISRQAAQQRWG